MKVKPIKLLKLFHSDLIWLKIVRIGLSYPYNSSLRNYPTYIIQPELGFSTFSSLKKKRRTITS